MGPKVQAPRSGHRACQLSLSLYQRFTTRLDTHESLTMASPMNMMRKEDNAQPQIIDTGPP
jgi:hypothetical protein